VNTPPVDGPDDFPALWVVPLNEPPLPPAPPDGLPPASEVPLLTLFQPDDPPSDVGWTPRLRRFDEAA
jgi:hypothetical protein